MNSDSGNEKSGAVAPLFLMFEMGSTEIIFKPPAGIHPWAQEQDLR